MNLPEGMMTVGALTVIIGMVAGGKRLEALDPMMAAVCFAVALVGILLFFAGYMIGMNRLRRE